MSPFITYVIQLQQLIQLLLLSFTDVTSSTLKYISNSNYSVSSQFALYASSSFSEKIGVSKNISFYKKYSIPSLDHSMIKGNSSTYISVPFTSCPVLSVDPSLYICTPTNTLPFFNSLILKIITKRNF